MPSGNFAPNPFSNSPNMDSRDPGDAWMTPPPADNFANLWPNSNQPYGQPNAAPAWQGPAQTPGYNGSASWGDNGVQFNGQPAGGFYPGQAPTAPNQYDIRQGGSQFQQNPNPNAYVRPPRVERHKPKNGVFKRIRAQITKVFKGANYGKIAQETFRAAPERFQQDMSTAGRVAMGFAQTRYQPPATFRDSRPQYGGNFQQPAPAPFGGNFMRQQVPDFGANFGQPPRATQYGNVPPQDYDGRFQQAPPQYGGNVAPQHRAEASYGNQPPRNGMMQRAAEAARGSAPAQMASEMYGKLPQPAQQIVSEAGRGALREVKGQYINDRGNVKVRAVAGAAFNPHAALARAGAGAVKGARQGAIQGGRDVIAQQVPYGQQALGYMDRRNGR